MKRTVLILAAALLLAVGGGLTPVFSGEAAQTGAAQSEALRVNLNTASATELAELPGIGETVADRIVAYREENGRFRSIEEIMNVKGIGEKIFARIRTNVFVDDESKEKQKM